jgi:hypothetical protein
MAGTPFSGLDGSGDIGTVDISRPLLVGAGPGAGVAALGRVGCAEKESSPTRPRTRGSSVASQAYEERGCETSARSSGETHV